MKSCAVLLAGPIRFMESTIRRLDNIKGEVELTYFICIWNKDLGNKPRAEEEKLSVNSLLEKYNIQFLTIGAPYDDSDYAQHIKLEVEKGQSNISNVAGMFKSMEILSKQLTISPISFDAALRIRTDCLLISRDFFKVNKPINEVYVAKNYLIPHAWISDHLMLTTPELMCDIWGWTGEKKFYDEYQLHDLNPEKLLAAKFKALKVKKIEKWIRYKDYQIIYFPAKKSEPKWINELLSNYTIKEIYQRIDELFDIDDLDLNELILKQKTNQDYYAKNILVKVAIKLRRKMGFDIR